ncbi:hypothetical protein L2X99_12050 [Microbacterium sp. KUDC0406]|uniref:hypothetical protein n=1 Tax=Microbacterium sp. KUDC0406 TaxID=2909588 RepID=UPI001F3A0562|nr:hypothetical protein [Microbacterium sp. KUDC0406]UJP09175.1 hypothetical protein L2X99_12050 [Microbacterium sp. KUDC0406]
MMASNRAHLQKRFTTAYLLLRMLQAAVLIVFLVASLLFTGGQVAAKGAPIWGAVLDYPLFVLPGWLMLAVSALGVLMVVPVLSLARLTDAGRVVGAFSATAAATAASFFFAWSSPVDPSSGLRWVAACTDGAVLVILLVVAGVIAYRSDRARAREGLPLWTEMDADDER